ncbi:YceI family protein [Glaciecola sp. MH2013]|uniref:YceI family protein n=1 Tax=Glaciecola sp. MH2013 TaxID=2785524 RepID=UPI00189D58CD|nr:YceI family protein [Glaciecola sp. MH2013]MBF7074368.1 YceI family protein [Glaciecola sp. MH2013]
MLINYCSTKTKPVLIALGLLLSSAVNADMTLDAESSSISFMSTKNANFSEQHTFDSFTGSLNDKGELVITIDMASVNTMIPIRNERMKSMLFKVSDYNQANFVAKVDKDLTSLAPGERKTATVKGDMTIVGNTVPVSFDVNVVGLAGNKLSVTTTKPTILSTSSFGLDEGVASLQNIAGLNSISTAVPLSFSVVFTKKN